MFLLLTSTGSTPQAFCFLSIPFSHSFSAIPRVQLPQTLWVLSISCHRSLFFHFHEFRSPVLSRLLVLCPIILVLHFHGFNSPGSHGFRVFRLVFSALSRVQLPQALWALSIASRCFLLFPGSTPPGLMGSEYFVPSSLLLHEFNFPGLDEFRVLCLLALDVPCLPKYDRCFPFTG